MVLFLLVLHIMVESLFNSYSVSTYKKCRYIYSHFGVFIFKIMVAILRVLYFAAERRTRKKQKTLHFYLCFPYHTKPYHTIPYHRLRTKIAFRHGWWYKWVGGHLHFKLHKSHQQQTTVCFWAPSTELYIMKYTHTLSYLHVLYSISECKICWY